jgi:hypothetical protein
VVKVNAKRIDLSSYCKLKFCQMARADPRIQAGIKEGAIEIYKP